MRNLFVPPSADFQIDLVTGFYLEGYVSYREGIESQGKIKTAYVGMDDAGGFKTVFTADPNIGCVIVGWCLYNSTDVSEVALSIDGNIVAKLTALPAQHLWTEQGVYTPSGQLSVTTVTGTNTVSGVIDADTVIVGLAPITNTLRKLQNALPLTPSQQLWIS
jgi:hypothetical protein